MIPTTHDTLQKVDGILNGRQGNYADPLINFDRIAKMWSVILDRPVNMTEVAMCMVALKICREVAVSQPDNADDTVGYGACWARVAAYEREQAEQPKTRGGPVEPGTFPVVGEPGPEASYVVYDNPVTPKPLTLDQVGTALGIRQPPGTGKTVIKAIGLNGAKDRLEDLKNE